MNSGIFAVENENVMVIVIKKINVSDYFASGEAAKVLMEKK